MENRLKVAACTATLDQLYGDLIVCSGALSQAQDDLATCTNDLLTCQANVGAFPASGWRPVCGPCAAALYSG